MINPADRKLTVLLRQTQWLIDDAANDIPAGRYRTDQRDELAVLLENLAALIRATTSVVAEFESPGPSALPRQPFG